MNESLVGIEWCASFGFWCRCQCRICFFDCFNPEIIWDALGPLHTELVTPIAKAMKQARPGKRRTLGIKSFLATKPR